LYSPNACDADSMFLSTPCHAFPTSFSVFPRAMLSIAFFPPSSPQFRISQPFSAIVHLQSLTPSPLPLSSVPESNSSPPNPRAQPAPAPVRRETAAPKSQPCSAAATPCRSAAHPRPPNTVRAKCRAVCLSTDGRVCRRVVALGALGRRCRGLRGGGSCGRFWSIGIRRAGRVRIGWEAMLVVDLVDFRGEDGGLWDDVPCVCDDDVVEWGVLLAEARETYP
jgi:hypothetical protein